MSEIDSLLKDAPEYNPSAGQSTHASAKPRSEVDDLLKDAPTQARGLKGWAGDIAATALKGAVGVPESLVGLADIPTGGRVGKFLENQGGTVGFRPKQAREYIPSEPSRFIAEMGKDDIRFSGGKLAVEPDKATGSARLDALKAMLAGNKR